MRTRDYYDHFASSYEAERQGGYHALVDRLEVEIALRYVAGREVIEAGCGTGLLLTRLAARTHLAVGVDLSFGMLRKAAARGLKVVQGSVTSLPFPDGRFDAACAFKVLPHVKDVRAAVRELARVTRPGGHLVLEFYNPHSLRGLVKRWKRPTPIGSGARATDHAVYTRYDTLAEVRGHLPPELEVVAVRGIRVVTPLAAVFRVFPLDRVFRFLEERLCDLPGFRQLGGFLVVVARKPPSTRAG